MQLYKHCTLLLCFPGNLSNILKSSFLLNPCKELHLASVLWGWYWSLRFFQRNLSCPGISKYVPLVYYVWFTLWFATLFNPHLLSLTLIVSFYFEKSIISIISNKRLSVEISNTETLKNNLLRHTLAIF